MRISRLRLKGWRRNMMRVQTLLSNNGSGGIYRWIYQPSYVVAQSRVFTGTCSGHRAEHFGVVEAANEQTNSACFRAAFLAMLRIAEPNAAMRRFPNGSK